MYRAEQKTDFWSPCEGVRTVEEIDQEIDRLKRLSSRQADVVVVDDMPIMRLLLSQALRQAGFTRVHKASDGKIAFNTIVDQYCDLALVDWNMPNMDGLELLDRIRSHEDFYDIVFIMVTAETVDTKVIQAAEEKQDAYLTKPVSPEKLNRRLDLILNRRLITAKALQLEAMGKHQQAAELFMASANNRPQARWTIFRLGELFARQGRWQEAEECYNRILETDPEAASAMVSLGKIYETLGDVEEGQRFFRKAMRISPKYFKAYDMLALSMWQEGRKEEACQVLQKAIRNQGSENACRQEKLGYLHEDLKQYPEAESCFLKALDLKPRHNVAKNNLAVGKLRLAQGLWQEAQVPLRKAADLTSDGDSQIRLSAMLLMGESLIKGDLAEDAEVHFKSIFDVNRWPEKNLPVDMKDLYLRISEIYFKAGDQRLAGQYYEMSRDDETINAMESRQLKKQNSQAENLVKTVKIDELSRLGLDLVEKGKYRDGLKKYQEALSLAPDSCRVHFNIALALYRMDKNNQANRFLKDAAKLGIKSLDGELIIRLTGFLERRGLTDHACKILEQYLEKQPNDQRIQKALVDMAG